jgi:hypothetical protein
MKKNPSIIHWILPMLLLVALILLLIWDQNLSVPDIDHEWISIGLILAFFFCIQFWISKNPNEFFVGRDYLDSVPEEKEYKNDQNH